MIEKIEKILNENTDAIMVTAHQINDDWFIAELHYLVVNYKSWFCRILGIKTESILRVMVPYKITDLAKVQNDMQFEEIVLGSISQSVYQLPRHKIERSQLRKWGSAYKDTQHRLYTTFCNCQNKGK